MAKDSSPICFRVEFEDRILLEAVARYVGESMSTFVRRSAVDVARSLVDDEGAEVLRSFREMLLRRSDRGSEQMVRASEQLENLIAQWTYAQQQSSTDG